MASYIGIIHKDAKSDFGVSFPDFPGIATAGQSLDQAREFAAEALALHIEGLIEDGEPLPEPSTLDAIMSKKKNQYGVAILVQAPELPDRVVRVNITVPERTLALIDRTAEHQGKTRSGLLISAFLDYERQQRQGSTVVDSESIGNWRIARKEGTTTSVDRDTNQNWWGQLAALAAAIEPLPMPNEQNRADYTLIQLVSRYQHIRQLLSEAGTKISDPEMDRLVQEVTSRRSSAGL